MFQSGAAANPFVEPFDWRPQRLAKKVAAGAQFVQTQYCYDIERLKGYMNVARDLGLDKKVFILVGVGPLESARAAEFIRSNVPGVYIPDSVIDRLKGAEDQKKEGLQLWVEMMQQVREIEGVAGVHGMAYRQEKHVPELVERSGVLEGRTPWHPDLYKGDAIVQHILDSTQ